MIYYDTQQITLNSFQNRVVSYSYNNSLLIFCIFSFQETERSRVGHGDLLKSRKGKFSVMNIKYLYFQHMKQRAKICLQSKKLQALKCIQLQTYSRVPKHLCSLIIFHHRVNIFSGYLSSTVCLNFCLINRFRSS